MEGESTRVKADKYFIREKLESIDNKLDSLLSIMESQPLTSKTRKTKKTKTLQGAEEVLKTLSPEAVSNAVAMAAAAVADEKAKPPKKGPLQWNEFVTQYIKDQAAKGIIIKRPNAMRNNAVKQAYRNKYGLRAAAPKTKKVNKTVVPLTVEAPLPAPSGVPKTKKVRVLAPTNEAPVTPGRSSPPVRQSPASAVLAAPAVPAVPAASASLNKNQAPALDYEEMETNPNTGLTTVRIGSNIYYKVPEDNGLYRRNENGSLGPWVGYLSNNKRIRYTNAPEGEDP
jgi:hypothetical protein